MTTDDLRAITINGEHAQLRGPSQGNSLRAVAINQGGRSTDTQDQLRTLRK